MDFIIPWSLGSSPSRPTIFIKHLESKELAAISGGCEANCHHRMDGAKTETEHQQILDRVSS